MNAQIYFNLRLYLEVTVICKSQINPSSSSVVTQAVARLFRGTFTRTTAASTSRPAKSKKRQHDPTSRRDSGFFLEDVMLLPSPRIKKIPCGKLREKPSH